MQKKLLLSLMLSVPAAQVAMANITLDSLKDPSKWNATGITGTDFQINETDNSVQCGIGTGIVRQTVTGLPAGEYTLSFTKSENISVKINGAEIEPDTDGAYEFTLEEDGDVTIEISAENVSLPFSFEKALITFVKNFAEEAADFTAELDKAKFDDIAETVPTDIKEALEEEKTTILNERKGIEEILASMAGADVDDYDDAISVDEFIKIYENYDLANNFDAITKMIEDYAAKVKAWNEKATLLTSVSDLTDKIDALIESINADDTPEYAKNLNIEAATNLKDDIEALTEEINEAYAGTVSDEDLNGFNAEITARDKDIDNLETKFNKDLADYKTWLDLTGQFSELEKLYQEAFSKITEYKGVYTDEDETYKNVYSDVQAEWLNQIGEAYNEAKTTYDADLKDGPTGLSSDKVKGEDGEDTDVLVKTAIADAIATATTTINDVLTTSEALVEDQNDQYTTAMGEDGIVHKLQAKYDELTKTVVPNNYKETFEAELEKAEKLLGQLKTFVDTHYRAHDLKVKDIDLTEINATLDELQNKADTYAPLNELQGLLDQAKDDIEKAYAESEIPEDVLNLPVAMESTYDEIQDAIDNITFVDGVADANEVAEVTEAIENLTVTANALIEIFGDVYTQLNAFETALDEYKTFIDEKVVVLSCLTDKDKLDKSQYTKFNTEVTGFIKDLKEAGQRSGSVLYTEAEKVKTAFEDKYGTVDGWKAILDADKLAFAKAVTDANYEAVKEYFDDLEAPEKVDLTTVETNLATIKDDIDAATTTEAYGKCDEELKKLGVSLESLKALMSSFTTIQDGIDNLTKDNEANSIGNGKEYFVGVIAGIQEEFDDIVTRIQDKLNNSELSSDVFQTELDDLSDEIDKTKDDILDNNTYHTSQLGRSTEVRSAIQVIIDEIEGDKENPNDPTIIAGWIDALKSLQQNDLIANDLAVADAYGKGESKAQDETIMAEYARILEEANKILGEFNGEYGQAVIDANTTLVENTLGWPDRLGELYSEYLDAIGEYNAYIYGLKNAGYKDAVINGYEGLPGIDSHVTLYKYAALITELRSQASNTLCEANKGKKVLTEDTFKPEEWDGEANTRTYVEIANDYLTAMQNQVETMNSEAKAIAVKYYEVNLNAAKDLVKESETTMANEGISEEISKESLKEARRLIKLAQSLYVSVLKDNKKAAANPDYKAKYKALGIEMDKVADLLDKVEPSINLQKAAETQWGNSYAEAQTTINEYKDKLDEFAKVVSDDKAEAIKDLIDDFDEIVDKITALNDSANETKEGLINDFKANYLDPLAGYLAELDELVAAGKTQDDMEAAVDDFNTALGELKDYIDNFTNTYTIGTADIESKIEDFDTLVNGPGALVDAATLESMKTEIDDDIKAKYEEVANTGLSALDLWGDKLKIAFNDASNKNADAAEPFTPKQLEDINADIDKYIVEAGLFKTVTNEEGKGYTYETRDEFQEGVIALLTKMTAMYKTLQSSWTDNPVDLTVKALTELYTSISDSIAENEAVLAGCEEGVQEMYAGKYEDLQKDLEAIKTAWEAQEKSTLVIASQEKFEYQLGEVQKLVDALKNEIALEQQKQLTSNTKATELQNEYDELYAEYERIEAEINDYQLIDPDNENDYFQTQLDDLQARFDDVKTWLDENKESYSFTESSTLQDKGWLTIRLFYLDCQANYRYYIKTGNSAKNVLDKVYDALTNGDVIDIDELRLKYNELDKRYTDNNNLGFSPTEERLDDYKNRSEENIAIEAEANALLESVQANKYVPGDVNLNPDGVIDAVDVQLLVQWVGEGVTYDDLLTENPRQAYAADVTGDKKINIADVTAVINLIMGKTPAQVYADQFRSPGMQGSDHYTIAYVGEVDGADRYAIVLNNSNDFVAGQFDIKLGAGMSIVNVIGADRSENHNIHVYDKSMTEARVVIFSLENARIAGNTGAVVYVDVRGKGNVAVEEMIFSDGFAKAYNVSGSGSSGIMDTVIETIKDAKEAIYDAAGRVYDRIQRGINIIRRSDGSVSKELHK